MRFRRNQLFLRWLSQPLDAGNNQVASTDPALPVLVVGAGPAGLAAWAALKQAGVDFQGVEGHTPAGRVLGTADPLSSDYDL